MQSSSRCAKHASLLTGECARHAPEVLGCPALRGEVSKGPPHGILSQTQRVGCLRNRDLVLPGIQKVIELLEGDAEEELLIAHGKAEGVWAWAAGNDLG